MNLGSPQAIGFQRRWDVRTAEAETGLLEILYETIGQTRGWDRFMDALTRTYAGGRGLFAMHDVALRNGTALAGGQWEADYFSAYNAHYASVNPWVPSLGRRPIGRAVPAEFMLPHAELIRTEFYQDFLRHLRLDSGVGVTIQQDGARHMVVSVLFPHGTAERDDDVVGRLQRLVPHLLRVAQVNRQFAGLETRAAVAEAALDRVALATIVVRAACRVVHLNAAAECIVAAGDGLSARNNTLDAANPAEARSLRGLVATALLANRDIAATPGGTLRLTRPSGRVPYEVLVAPIAETTLALGFGGPQAVVFVRDPETQPVAPADHFQRLYALTSAEARLMQALIGGQSLDEVGARFGVGKETLRSQLKSVFIKTGTSTQGELLRLGLRGIGGLRL
jgi:DNA-binding CsgD family transcriptional regulator